MDRPEGGFAPSIWEMSAKIFFKKVVAPIFFNQPANDAEIKKAADEELPPLFDYLESQLGAGPFIVGPQFSIGDLGIATQFVNLRLAGFGVDPARWAKLARYVAAVHERPSFKPLIAEEKASLGIA
jgi:glutathione S-transferase